MQILTQFPCISTHFRYRPLSSGNRLSLDRNISTKTILYQSDGENGMLLENRNKFFVIAPRRPRRSGIFATRIDLALRRHPHSSLQEAADEAQRRTFTPVIQCRGRDSRYVAVTATKLSRLSTTRLELTTRNCFAHSKARRAGSPRIQRQRKPRLNARCFSRWKLVIRYQQRVGCSATYHDFVIRSPILPSPRRVGNAKCERRSVKCGSRLRNLIES